MSEPASSPPDNQRRLAAIVFTDVVGYSARMQQDETGTLALVKADFARLRAHCAEHGGEVLNTMGDGMLLCFDSAVQAVTCALAAQKEFASRGTAALQHRMGIHLGDVFREKDGGVAGDGVNVAARIEGKARPGTVALSQSVFDVVKGKVPMQVAPLGAQTLKNISEPISVFLVAPEGAVSFATAPAGRRYRGWWIGLGVVAAVVAGVVFWPAKPVPSAPAVPAGSPADPTVALVKQARELCVGVNNFTRDKLQLAEQLARKATEQNPAAAETWSVLGYINMTYIMRGYDKTPARFEAVRSYANRALALAPEQSEACLTLGIMTGLYDGDRVVAERYYQRALKADPSDNRVRRYYSQLLIFSKRAPEAIALLREGVKMHPEDVLVRYELVVQNLLLADYPAAWKEAQAMLEIQSFGSGWTLKAMLCAQWKGDLPAMRLALDRLSQEEKTEDRPVYLLMWCALAERKPELALESARLTPREFLEDNYFTGPKTWLTARAHALLGQDNLAMLDYVLAETVIRARLARNPGGQDDRLCLAITLALAGRIPEARQEMAPLEAAAQEQPSLLLVRRLAQYYGALGETSRAVAYLRQHDKRADSSFTAFTPSILRLDPWWDKLRGQAEFETLLNDPAYCAWSR